MCVLTCVSVEEAQDTEVVVQAHALQLDGPVRRPHGQGPVDTHGARAPGGDNCESWYSSLTLRRNAQNTTAVAPPDPLDLGMNRPSTVSWKDYMYVNSVGVPLNQLLKFLSRTHDKIK